MDQRKWNHCDNSKLACSNDYDNEINAKEQTQVSLLTQIKEDYDVAQGPKNPFSL